MSELEIPAFQLQQLGYFPHFFSDEERDALKKWGVHAAGLTEGAILPTSDRENKFVEVAKGKAPPLTRFQRIWLRYLQAIDIQTKWRESERKLITTTSLLSMANLQIEQLQGDVVRLTKLWEFARNPGVSAAINFSNHNSQTEPLDLSKSSIQQTDVCHGQVALKTDKSISVWDVTSRDLYLQLTESGLKALTDNEIFILFNLVDGLGLKAQEVANFNIEHSRRSAKYHASNSFGVSDWDWRDQNESH